MNLKEWSKKFKRGEYSDVLPVFKVDDENKAQDIINELDRLGFLDGNMCARIENTKYIDIWYSDFYNTFHVYETQEGCFFATLAELKEM